MRKITIIKVFLLFSLVLITTNCATEEIGRENTKTAAEAKMWFDNNKSNYNETVLKFVNELQWENSIVSNGEIGEVIEVPFTLANNLSTTNTDAALFNDHHRLMFVKDENKEFKLFYVQIFSNDKNYDILDANYNYYTIKDNFDGEVYVQELSSSKGTRLEFANGKKVQQSLTTKMQEYHCVYFGYWSSGGSFTALYEVGCYGGGGGNGVPSGGGEINNPGPGYGGGSSSTPSNSCPAGYVYKFGECILDQRIFNELTGKAKCLNDLLNKNGDSFIQNLLAKFEGVSKYNISITSKDKVTSSKNGVITEINGRTFPPVDNLIKIEISTSKADSNSALDVARTILHEYIHADIFRKIGTILKTDTDKESLDFKTTYEAYREQHSTIAVLYLNGMKEALKGFHKTVLIDDYNKYTQYYNEEPSDAFYEALAWGGLKDADVKAWADLPAEKKEAIEALAKRVPMLSKAAPCTN